MFIGLALTCQWTSGRSMEETLSYGLGLTFGIAVRYFVLTGVTFAYLNRQEIEREFKPLLGHLPSTTLAPFLGCVLLILHLISGMDAWFYIARSVTFFSLVLLFTYRISKAYRLPLKKLAPMLVIVAIVYLSIDMYKGIRL